MIAMKNREPARLPRYETIQFFSTSTTDTRRSVWTTWLAVYHKTVEQSIRRNAVVMNMTLLVKRSAPLNTIMTSPAFDQLQSLLVVNDY